MNSSGFGWELLLHTDAEGRSLKAALFTTYDRADERLLAEHLLPLLLNLSHEPEGEGAERQYFLVELQERLSQLHDKLVIISSTAREEPESLEEGESGTYGWIWRSIRPLTVGSRDRAVQHAKIWLLHWGADDNGIEHLEIVVSSANLTRAAFKGQLQGVWRACIELRPLPSEARRRKWGVLPAFLRELAASADDKARLDPFVELLARAECPEGVVFVASVPGKHSRQDLRRTPWGAAGLGAIMPSGRGTVTMSILSPFVGLWSADTLIGWCSRFGGLPDRLRLVWIDKDHPWAKRWVLPKTTLRTLIGSGASLLHLRHDSDQRHNIDPFHEERRAADDRWSHAKVYSLKRSNSFRLIVTSANFSAAAWGAEGRDGGLTIENFELGVCVEQGSWPFDNLEIFEDTKSAATVADIPNRGTSLISWARATWDGKTVNVGCRCESSRELKGEISGDSERVPINIWTVDGDGRLRSAQLPWAEAERSPSMVLLTCEHQSVTIAVFDERPLPERQDDLPPEVDKDLGQIIRDALLFEQYGGQDKDDIEHQSSAGDVPEDSESGAEAALEEGMTEAEARHQDSYAVPAFVAAGMQFRVVDNWAEQVKREARRSTGEFERQILRRDGELLIEAFKRQAARDGKKSATMAIGARLAAEELTLRLEYFPEE